MEALSNSGINAPPAAIFAGDGTPASLSFSKQKACFHRISGIMGCIDEESPPEMSVGSFSCVD